MFNSLRRSRAGVALFGAPKSSSANGLSEQEPLLGGEGARAVQSTPLPVKQVFVLCLMRFGEPIAFTLIFPFVARFVEDLMPDLDKRKVGYYAGLIESLFAFTTFTTVLAWGRLSDRIGRKPVLLIGLIGVTLSIVSFGMATKFWHLVLARCIGGALNGNVAVIKSVLGEITDESNQGRAFSFLPLAWSTGSVIGPLLGGYLSHPATNFPHVPLFQHPFFTTDYPYALPCFIGALFPLAGAIIGFFFLDESLPPSKSSLSTSGADEETPFLRDREQERSGRRHARYVAATSTTLPAPPGQVRRLEEDDGTDSGYSTPARDELGLGAPLGAGAGGASRSASRQASGSRSRMVQEITEENMRKRQAREHPSFRSLFTRRVCIALVAYAMLALETVALDALLILFCYSPLSIGGLGFKESSIGTALSLSGLSAVSFQLLLFPPLQARVGTVPLYRALMSLWPVVFALFPVMSYAAQHWGTKAVWGWLTVFLMLKSIANMSYATNMLTLTDAAPSKRLLGTLNGVAQMGSSLMRSVGPFTASSLFAFSVSHPSILNGELVFLVMVLLAGGGAVSTYYLEEGGRASAGEEAER
ncbi:hypothetical protein JCM10207_006348 [Rhodosporidiobolus poonsookiae]